MVISFWNVLLFTHFDLHFPQGKIPVIPFPRKSADPTWWLKTSRNPAPSGPLFGHGWLLLLMVQKSHFQPPFGCKETLPYINGISTINLNWWSPDFWTINRIPDAFFSQVPTVCWRKPSSFDEQGAKNVACSARWWVFFVSNPYGENLDGNKGSKG